MTKERVKKKGQRKTVNKMEKEKKKNEIKKHIFYNCGQTDLVLGY